MIDACYLVCLEFKCHLNNKQVFRLPLEDWTLKVLILDVSGIRESGIQSVTVLYLTFTFRSRVCLFSNNLTKFISKTKLVFQIKIPIMFLFSPTAHK